MMVDTSYTPQSENNSSEKHTEENTAINIILPLFTATLHKSTFIKKINCVTECGRGKENENLSHEGEGADEAILVLIKMQAEVMSVLFRCTSVPGSSFTGPHSSFIHMQQAASVRLICVCSFNFEYQLQTGRFCLFAFRVFHPCNDNCDSTLREETPHSDSDIFISLSLLPLQCQLLSSCCICIMINIYDKSSAITGLCSRLCNTIH